MSICMYREMFLLTFFWAGPKGRVPLVKVKRFALEAFADKNSGQQHP